jgi:tryptophan-rich sensory protein
VSGSGRNEGLVNTKSLGFAIAVCVAGMISEAALAGKGANTVMRSLKQPAWALPAWAWYFIGMAYYAACFASLYRVNIGSGSGTRLLCLALLIIVMAANAAWNFIFFRRRDLRLSFYFFLPYTILVLVLVCALSRFDWVSAVIFAIYVMYLPCALVWSHRTWKLNGG